MALLYLFSPKPSSLKWIWTESINSCQHGMHKISKMWKLLPKGRSYFFSTEFRQDAATFFKIILYLFKFRPLILAQCSDCVTDLAVPSLPWGIIFINPYKCIKLDENSANRFGLEMLLLSVICRRQFFLLPFRLSTLCFPWAHRTDWLDDWWPHVVLLYFMHY